jgi:hypothetical protein
MPIRFICLILSFTCLFHDLSWAGKKRKNREAPPVPFEKNLHLPMPVWQAAQPYLLPWDHPIRKKLDKIFTASRAITNVAAFEKAGFKFRLRNNRQMIVAKHRDLKNYVVKVYLDDCPCEEWTPFIKRIIGSQIIRASIEQNHFEKQLKAPQKWLYPLPNAHFPNTGIPRFFVLVAEDMHIANPDKNRLKYMHSMTRETMWALFVVLSQNLLFDSTFIDNVPFSEDERLAFVDTEHYGSAFPMRYFRLTPYFSPGMQHFWNELTQGN